MSLDIDDLRSIVMQYDSIRERFPDVKIRHKGCRVASLFNGNIWFESKSVDSTRTGFAIQFHEGYMYSVIYAVSVFECDMFKVFGSRVDIGWMASIQASYKLHDFMKQDVENTFGKGSYEIISKQVKELMNKNGKFEVES